MKSYGKRKRTKKRGTRRLRRRPNKSLRRTIARLISRSQETKMNQETPAAQLISSTITNTEVFNLLPAITQGTGEASRVGNRIRPTYMQVKIAIIAANMNAVYSGASSTYFDLYIFKYKGANQGGGVPTATDMNKFLQDDNTSQSYNGQILDGLRPINSDLFTLIKKRRLTLNNIFNTSVLNMSGYYQSVNPQKTLTFNLTKYLKKSLIYDDNSSLVMNDNMYIAIGSTQCDGTTVAGFSTGTYQYFTNLKYKDS